MTTLVQLAKQLAALKQGNNAYSDEGAVRKATLHRTGRRFLRLLAQELGLAAGTFTARSNEGGIAVSGEVSLHADHLYVQLSESCVQAPGVEVMFRSCAGRQDYCGGVNHWSSAARLATGGLEAFKAQCLDLMADGVAKARDAAIKKLQAATPVTTSLSTRQGEVVEDDLVW